MKHTNLIKLSLVTLLLAGCSNSSTSSSSQKEYARVNAYNDLPIDLLNQKSEQMETGRYMGYSVRLTPDLCSVDLVDEEHQVYDQEVREMENKYCDSSSNSRNSYGVKAQSVSGLADTFWDALRLNDINRDEKITSYMKLKVENYFNKMFSHTLKTIDDNECKTLYVLMEQSSRWTIISRGQGVWNAEINENFKKACEDAIKENTYSSYCNIFDTYGIGVINRLIYWPANTAFLGFSSKDYYANITMNSYIQSDIETFMSDFVKDEGSLNLCDYTLNTAETNSWRLLDFEFTPIYRALDGLSMSDEAGFKQAYDRYITEKTNELKAKVQSPTVSMPSYLRDSLQVLRAQEDSTIGLGKNTKYKVDLTPTKADYSPAKMAELGFTKVFIRPKIRQNMKSLMVKMDDEITIGDKCVKMLSNEHIHTNSTKGTNAKWHEFDINDLLSNESVIHYEYSVDATIDVTSVELELCYAK